MSYWTIIERFYLSVKKLLRITADNQLNQSWSQVNKRSRHYSRVKIALPLACTWLADSATKICLPINEYSNEKQIKHEM